MWLTRASFKFSENGHDGSRGPSVERWTPEAKRLEEVDHSMR